MTNENIMIKIENVKSLLMEISFINGFLSSLEKSLPEMRELNKIIEQLK